MIAKQNKKDFSIYIHNAVMKSKINLDKTFVFTDVKGDIDKFAEDVVGHLGHFIEEGPESISLVQVNGNKIDLFGVTNGTLKKEFQKEVDKLGGINAEDYVDMNTNEEEVIDLDNIEAELIGKTVTINKSDYSQVSGKVINVNVKKTMLDLTKGVKGVETNVWVTVKDEMGKEHTGFFYELVKESKTESVYLKNSNLSLWGAGRDSNGNSTVIVSFGDNPKFSIQTNDSELQNIKSILGSNKDITKISSDDLDKIEKNVISYIKQYGTKKQKTTLKIYNDKNTNEEQTVDVTDDWDDIVKEYGFDDMKAKALIAFKNNHIDKIKDAKNETDLWTILDSLDLIDEFVSFYHLEKHFVKESVYDNLKTVKELAAQRLADFFRVDVKSLTSFNFDGTDDIKKLTAALNSTSDTGTELYYNTAITLAKSDLNESASENDTEETAYRWWRDKLSINQMKQLGKKYLSEYEYGSLLGDTAKYVFKNKDMQEINLKKTKKLINKIFTQVLVDSPDLVNEAKNIKELSKVISKRRVMDFETFKSKRKDIENDSKEEKGEHELVKASKTGSVDGKKGYAVIDEGKINEKNNLQAKALVIDNALKVAKFTSADEHVSDFDYDIDYNTANIVAATSDIAKDIAKEIKRIGYNVEVTDNMIEVLDEVSESKSTGIPNLTISKMTFEEAYKDNPMDGIVLLGCGGDVNEWIVGVSNNLKEEGVSKTDKPDELWADVRILTTSGGRTDVMLTPKKGAPLDLGKMAMWRIRFGDCSWISDYKDNYKEQHKA